MRVVIALAAVAGALAQAGPIRFSGSTSLYAEFDTLVGTAQSYESRTLRWTLTPTLTVYNVPFSLDLFLSTEESNLRQSIDRYRVYFNPESLRQLIRLPGSITLSGLELGTCRPSFTPRTLAGVSLTGGAVEFNPWLFYVAAAAGRAQRAVVGVDSSDPAYSRMLYAGRVGIGKKDRSFLVLTLLNARDDPNSIPSVTFPLPPDTTDTIPRPDTVELLAPQENHLAGLEGRLALFGGRWVLAAEVAGSEYTRDVRTQEMDLVDIPTWAARLLHPRLATSYDYSYCARSELTVLGTRLLGRVEMVGPGFVSLGAPTLTSDRFAYEARVERSFLGSRLTLAGSYGEERDDLILQKASPTRRTRASIDVGLALDNLPALQLGYAPIRARGAADTNRTDVVLGSTSYCYSIAGRAAVTSLWGSYQRSDQRPDTTDSRSFDLTLSQTLQIAAPLNVTVGAGASQTVAAGRPDWLFSGDASLAYAPVGAWVNTLGFRYAGAPAATRRLGISFATALPVWKLGDLSLRIEGTRCRGAANGANFDQLRGRATLSRSW